LLCDRRGNWRAPLDQDGRGCAKLFAGYRPDYRIKIELTAIDAQRAAEAAADIDVALMLSVPQASAADAAEQETGLAAKRPCCRGRWNPSSIGAVLRYVLVAAHKCVAAPTRSSITTGNES